MIVVKNDIIPKKNNMIFAFGTQYVTYNKTSNFYSNAILWKSIDGGKNWKTVLATEDTTLGFADYSFNDRGDGILLTGVQLGAGKYHRQSGIYMTSDFGDTWRRSPIDTNLPYGWSFKCAIGSPKNAWLYLHPNLFVYSPSDTLSVVSDFATEPGSQIKVYPNPLSIGQSMGIYFDASITEDLFIDVYSSDGKLVDSHNFRGKIDQVQYTPDSGIKAGVYYLQIRYGKSNIIKNFVVE